MNFALNHMTVPNLGYVALLDLAAKLGCAGVELRNDLKLPLFDGMPAVEAGRIARDKGVRLFGLSQVYPFNDWNDERRAAVRDLIDTAQAAGAETISLIPRNDGQGVGDGDRQAHLRAALAAILPMLREAPMMALVEPLGFLRSSLRSKQELVDAIAAIGGGERFRLVHDTFHHALAREMRFFPEATGMVHISAVADPAPDLEQMEDEHRGLIDARDRLGNVEQLRALIAAGYAGPVSYECFSPQAHDLADAYTEIKRSFDFITSRLLQEAA